MTYVVLTLKDGTKTPRITIAQSENYYRDMINYVVGFQLFGEMNAG